MKREFEKGIHKERDIEEVCNKLNIKVEEIEELSYKLGGSGRIVYRRLEQITGFNVKEYGKSRLLGYTHNPTYFATIIIEGYFQELRDLVEEYYECKKKKKYDIESNDLVRLSKKLGEVRDDIGKYERGLKQKREEEVYIKEMIFKCL